MQGSELAASQPIVNGIRLAVKQAGGAAGGYKIDIPDSAIYDDALNGAHDAQTGANNMTKIVGEPDVIAVVGPLNSSVAKAQIPISNESGLLQCSPANTNPDLTKGAPAAQLRTKPNNYIRVVTTDDVQGPAAAQYIYDVLKKTSVYIIDDTETFGKGVADAFDKEFVKRGGKVVKHDAAPKTTQDYVSIMTAAKALNPQAIYFGGVTATGGARILLAAAQVGLGDIPYVGPDGINDGSGATKDSFLNLAADKAKNSFSTLAGIGLQGRVQHRPDRLRRNRLRLCPGGHRRTQPRRRDEPGGYDGPSGSRPRRRHGHSREVHHDRRRHHVRCQRRHEPEDRFDLLGRCCRRKRQGRLEVRNAGRLRQVKAARAKAGDPAGSPAYVYPSSVPRSQGTST
jgi:hypothetical protein